MKTEKKPQQKNRKSDPILAVVGLGYVGLPLAVIFGQHGYRVIGYDKSERKISELKQGIESMNEVDPEELAQAKLELTNNPADIRKAKIIIVAVPTPVTKTNIPDMTILHAATKTVGKQLQKGMIVTFESTVYPGATEDECVPILEQESGLKCGVDFSVGYSPERVNPGDKNHTIDKIVKVVSGSDEKTTDTLVELYGSIVTAGIHRARNIKTAETSKVIENWQRDINIAMMNELSLICDRLGDVRTLDVIDAATTKWNIHRYTPGLVGGHCIGVDPYYLEYKAKELGITTRVLTAGRGINDYMPVHVAQITIKAMIEGEKHIKRSRVLVMGLTFKENVKDTRNAKITKTIRELQEHGIEVIGHDPLIDEADLDPHEYPPITFTKDLPEGLVIDAVILAAGHKEFEEITDRDILRLHGGRIPVVIDIRNFFDRSIAGEYGIYRSL